MLYIKKTVFTKIDKFFSTSKLEQGGIIGIKRDVIFSFEEDIAPRFNSRKIYYPNTDYLERIIAKWETDRIIFGGMIHSHNINPSPSNEDIQYIQDILSINCLSELLLGIFLKRDNTLLLYSVNESNVCKIDYKIID